MVFYFSGFVHNEVKSRCLLAQINKCLSPNTVGGIFKHITCTKRGTRCIENWVIVLQNNRITKIIRILLIVLTSFTSFTYGYARYAHCLVY